MSLFGSVFGVGEDIVDSIFGSGTGARIGSAITGALGDIDEAALLSLLASGAYSSGALDKFFGATGLDFLKSDANAPGPTGYQGSIPEYTAIRQQIPQSGIATPRPGAAGQRYFTDVIYAQKPDTPVPTLEEARQQSATQAEQLAAQNPVARTMAAGGLASLAKGGYYLGGTTDGMADRVPARIDGRQEARLSDGEFVVPADVVSHLGNGNSNAGAQQLYDMMDRVRKARTGRESQGTQINPSRYMPGMRA